LDRRPGQSEAAARSVAEWVVAHPAAGALHSLPARLNGWSTPTASISEPSARQRVLAAYRTRSSQDSGSRQDVHPIERLIIPLDAPIEGVRVTSKGVAGPQAAEFRMAEQHNGLGEVAVASPCRPRSPLIGQEKVRTHRGHSAAHPVCGMIPEIIGVRDWRL